MRRRVPDRRDEKEFREFYNDAAAMIHRMAKDNSTGNREHLNLCRHFSQAFLVYPLSARDRRNIERGLKRIARRLDYEEAKRCQTLRERKSQAGSSAGR